MVGKNSHGRLDGAAIGLSTLCVIHCLGLPILATILPSVSAIAELEWLHKSFVVAAVPLSILAVFQSARHRAFLLVLGLVGPGILLLVAAAFVPALEAHETPLTVLGAVLLCIAHVLNWRFALSLSPKAI